MTTHGFALFDTAIGRCGIAWSERGVAGVQLPEARDADTRARLARRFPTAAEKLPPAHVGRAMDGIAALHSGEASDLSDVVLDLGGVPVFERRVYQIARTIPPGEAVSYGEVAARVGGPGAARAVGRALGRNPVPILVPCHRVVAADGGLGGFSASGGVTTKARLLRIEEAHGRGTRRLFEDEDSDES